MSVILTFTHSGVESFPGLGIYVRILRRGMRSRFDLRKANPDYNPHGIRRDLRALDLARIGWLKKQRRKLLD